MKTFMIVLCTSTLMFSQLVMAKPDHDKGLPPGLEKKLEKGQPLPPGWQKKLSAGQYLSDDYYRRSTLLKKPNADGIITIQIEGTVIELFHHTREIVRILDGKR
ncbi:hypothetical protein GCM10010919_03770 [Alishewanella longhuensis]|uniref:Nickel/cobalt transporter regulator n=1 Tax=Alishewanella longhuensis TaxID=1091037 RepID=A0ABQ3KTQ4_9ALTE|nr:hypothetical protein [Alishewanella longhuensis]GHG60362.1 hypothetical protein GCM10010919_03770 [Alishewanella longhuensis]